KIIGRFGAVDIRENQWAVIDSAGSMEFAEQKTDAKKVIETGIANPTFLRYTGNGSFLISDQTHTFLFSLSTHAKKVLVRERVVTAKTDTKTNKTYLLSRNKVYLYDKKGISEIYLTANVNILLKDLEVVDHKAIIISNAGMFVVSEAGVEMYSENDLLPTNSLNSIYYDRSSDCLFVGTGNKGLLKLQKKLFENYYQKKSLFFGSFCSLVPYKGNKFFVAGAKTIMQLSPGKPLSAIDIKASFSTLSVYNDTLFSGTWGYGLYLFSTVDSRMLVHIPIIGRNIHAVFRDRKGVYWIGTSEGALKGKDIMRLKEHLPDKINMRVTTICETKKGNIWMGGSDGVIVLDENGNICLRFNKANGVNATDVRSFYEDAAGKIWIGTYGGGLYCYNGKKLISLFQKPGYMLGSDMFTLARDAYGYILITTNHGLQAVHEDALNRFLNDEITYLIPFRFGTQSGLLNPEFNGGFLNNYATSDHLDFYFPSVQGIVRYKSEPFRQNENKLKITEVLVDNLVVDKPYSLPRQIQFLQFGFNKVVFSETANVYYQFQLVFSDNRAKWSKPQKGTSITFSYLK
ncbi:MAG: ligand-binding sensor domain-containing protein, partial [Bacteroidales bacterium]